MADTRLITGSGKLVWQETVELPDDGVHGPLLVRLRRGRGEGDALPALFMHSIGLSGRSWLPVIGNLSNVGEWVSVDLPGFGESGKPETASYQLSWQAARMQDLLDHLGWDEAVLVGNSMGGGIALAVSLAAPERVRGMALVNSVAFADLLPWIGKLGRIPLVRGMLALMTPAIASVSLKLARGIRNSVDPEDGSSCSRCFRDPAGRRAFFRSLEAMYGHELREMGARYQEIECPTLVLHGARDPLIKRASSERLSQALARAELGILGDLGHFAHEERPQEVARQIDRFLHEHGRE